MDYQVNYSDEVQYHCKDFKLCKCTLCVDLKSARCVHDMSGGCKCGHDRLLYIQSRGNECTGAIKHERK